MLRLNLFGWIFYTWLLSDIILFDEFLTITRIGIVIAFVFWLANKSTKIIISDVGIIGLITYNIISFLFTSDFLLSVSLLANTAIFIVLVSHYNDKDLDYSLFEDINSVIIRIVPLQLLIQFLSVLTPGSFFFNTTKVGYLVNEYGNVFNSSEWEIVLPGLFRDPTYMSYIFLSFLIVRIIQKAKNNLVKFDIYDLIIVVEILLGGSTSALLFLVVLLASQIKIGITYQNIKLISFSFIAAFLIILTIWNNVPKLKILTSTDFVNDERFDFRKVNAYIGLRMFQESPIVGKGYGTFMKFSLNLFPQQVLDSGYFKNYQKKGGIYSHNLIATAAGEGGIISLSSIIIYLIFTPYGLVFSKKSLKSQYFLFDLLVLIIAIIYGHRLDTFILFFVDLLRRVNKEKADKTSFYF